MSTKNKNGASSANGEDAIVLNGEATQVVPPKTE